jgi:hypothetical protein
MSVIFLAGVNALRHDQVPKPVPIMFLMYIIYQVVYVVYTTIGSMLGLHDEQLR